MYLELHRDLHRNFAIMILIALMWAQISQPELIISEGLLNTRPSGLYFMMALNQSQTLHSHLRLILGGDPFKVIRL